MPANRFPVLSEHTTNLNQDDVGYLYLPGQQENPIAVCANIPGQSMVVLPLWNFQVVKDPLTYDAIRNAAEGNRSSGRTLGARG
jgi:hypothetical protein